MSAPSTCSLRRSGGMLLHAQAASALRFAAAPCAAAPVQPKIHMHRNLVSGMPCGWAIWHNSTRQYAWTTAPPATHVFRCTCL